jgi:3-oxoacyl-(acyl-carrier-protein) synthase
MAAGGPFQIIACALAIRDHLIPPTANYEVADPTCDLDFVPNRSRKVRLNSTLVNVRGLGGGASSMVLARIAA